MVKRLTPEKYKCITLINNVHPDIVPFLEKVVFLQFTQQQKARKHKVRRLLPHDIIFSFVVMHMYCKCS